MAEIDDFKVPDGFILLPARKFDEPVSMHCRATGAVSYDIAEITRIYGEYLSDKMDHDIIVGSLNKAGWSKVVRCRDCRHFGQKGYKAEEANEFWDGSNAAEDTFCFLHSGYDYDYDYSDFWYVRPDDFCSHGEPMEES